MVRILCGQMMVAAIALFGIGFLGGSADVAVAQKAPTSKTAKPAKSKTTKPKASKTKTTKAKSTKAKSAKSKTAKTKTTKAKTAKKASKPKSKTKKKTVAKSPCQGLSGSACAVKASTCSWVKATKLKTGTTRKAHCRKKAKTAKK
ncbi:MAG: hypothetical protein AAFV69_09835 [Pseudomonadota bacterium]